MELCQNLSDLDNGNVAFNQSKFTIVDFVKNAETLFGVR